MNTINLLPVEERQLRKISRYRKTSYLVTTSLLVAYIVSVAGWIGFTLSVSGQEGKWSGEVERLAQEVNQMAAVEVLVRQVDMRVREIDRVVSSRVLVGEQMRTLAGGKVLGWDWRAGMGQEVQIEVAKPAEAENYAVGLRDKFKTIIIKTLSLQKDQTWRADIGLGGESK